MKALALALLTLMPLGAQDGTRVNLMFTVQDKKGRFISELGKEEFEVIENKKPQPILEFNAESDLPLRLAILIDTGNSVRDRFKFQQDAAIEFIDAAVRRGQDKALVMSFESAPVVVADLTDNREKLASAIRSLKPGGGAALYEAIAAACRTGESSGKYRRAIVILGAGEDNRSSITRDQALEMAQKADAVMYTISTNMTKSETAGDRVLKYYAQETGGQAFLPVEAAELAQSFENIANELRHQYSVVYSPPKADGLFHPVEIRLKSRKELVVRARRGYYAPNK